MSDSTSDEDSARNDSQSDARSDGNDSQMQSEVRDGMRIDWDAPITMDDGLVLRADIYRPDDDGRYPVLLSYGPYAKGLAFQEGYPSAWTRMATEHPDVTAGSTNKYQNWEVCDPEKWVPDGYVCLRIDARGCGRSPGYIDHFSPRETQDLYDSIEWAATQPWSNGKVGLSGVSYYAMNQWSVASHQPPSLVAMIPWEGAAEWYRDSTHHGGIVCTFWDNWYDMQVKTVQHGLGTRGSVNANTGELVSGPLTLSEEELAANRCRFGDDIVAHPLDDDYHADRSPDWSKVMVPFLSSANWGGQGLHPRGNFEAYTRAASPQRWLEVHGIEHWTEYYTDYGVALQKRFFGHFLKGTDTGWVANGSDGADGGDGGGGTDRNGGQPRVLLQVRHVDRFVERAEDDWPIPRTDWQRWHLHAEGHGLTPAPCEQPQTLSYEAMGDGLTFLTPPVIEETEITGPLAAKLFVSSSTADADLFVVFRVFDPDGEEVTFMGAIDPHTPIAQGWLRASHRELDDELSRPWRPYHTHRNPQPLVAGEVYELDIEIWPTCIVVPPGYRIGFSVRGRDYEYGGDTSGLRLSNFKNELRGCGPFLHNDPRDRPPEVFHNQVTLHFGPDHPNHVLVPVIPPK